MLTRSVQNKCWDLTLIGQDVARRWKGETPHARVAALVEGLPRGLPLREHVARIRESALRRNLAKLAQKAIDDIHDIAKDAASVLANLREELSEIDNGSYETEDLIALSSIEPRTIEWLWEFRLAVGMLAMLSGDPGAGKTYLALAIAADLSNGRVPSTDIGCQPSDTVYLSRENDIACVIRPRFDMLGGNPARFHLLGQNRAITLADISRLDAALVRTGAKLLIVDPVQSFLGVGVDAHRANETRPILDGLAYLAQKRRCSILLLRHLAKSNTGRAIHRGMGSIDFTGAVRTEMLAGTAADDSEARALVMVKSNLGVFAKSLSYSIGAQGFAWGEETDLRAYELLAPDGGSPDDGKASELDSWLRALLEKGCTPVTEIYAAANKNKWSKWQVMRAGERIGVRKTQAVGKKSGGWYWHLAHVQSVQPEQSDSKYAGKTTLPSDSTLQPDDSSDSRSDCSNDDMQCDINPFRNGQVASPCSGSITLLG